MATKTATLTVKFRGATDTADRSKVFTSVDVSEIYNAGYTSKQTVETYIVPFKIEFSDGTDYKFYRNVEVECAAIYNKGAQDAAPTPTVRYAYASNGGLVNIRATASSSGDVVGMVFTRTQLTVTGESGDYYAISVSNVTGYIKKEYTSSSSNSPNNYKHADTTYATGLAYYRYVYASNGGAVNVRTTAAANGSKIGLLTPKTRFVTANRTSNGFTEIFLYGIDNPGGVTITQNAGWMMTSFVSTSNQSNSNYSYTGWTYSSSQVIVTVPAGATIHCAEDPQGYRFEWMPCRYGTQYMGYMLSKYIIGTDANMTGSYDFSGSTSSSPPSSGGYSATTSASAELKSQPS